MRHHQHHTASVKSAAAERTARDTCVMSHDIGEREDARVRERESEGKRGFVVFVVLPSLIVPLFGLAYIRSDKHAQTHALQPRGRITLMSKYLCMNPGRQMDD